MNTAAKSPELNDDLSDLIGAPLRDQPAQPPASYNGGKPEGKLFQKPEPQTFTKPCNAPGCRNGKFISNRTGRVVGNCFRCQGLGTITTKTDTAKATAAKAGKKAQQIEAFKTEYPDVWAWMDGSTFGPAVDMRAKLEKYGSLFDSSIEAARRMIAKRDEATARIEAEKAQRLAGAPIADAAGVDRLKAAFDKAAAYTASKQTDTGMPLRLRSPKITIGTITISPAKATSANAGALYVKDAGEYMGKIMGGKFLATRECTDQQRSRILAFIADPKAAAEAYGKETGVCCVCNATLTSKWRLAGIGPICATKMGW